MKLYTSIFNNRKLNFIPTFGLPLSTCIDKTNLCDRYCYAKTHFYCYPTVKKKREVNYKFVNSNHFIDTMINEIKIIQPQFYRIHDSGDFFSQQYLDNWFTIIEENKDVSFLSFTKSYHSLNFSNKPSNMVVYQSIWDDYKSINPNLPVAYTQINHKNYTPSTLNINISADFKTCNSKCYECLYCFKNQGNVLFQTRKRGRNAN